MEKKIGVTLQLLMEIKRAQVWNKIDAVGLLAVRSAAVLLSAIEDGNGNGKLKVVEWPGQERKGAGHEMSRGGVDAERTQRQGQQKGVPCQRHLRAQTL